MTVEAIRSELDMIVDAAVSSVPVEAIYLFGSFADGTAREDSDIDVYVVVADDMEMRDLHAIWAIRKKMVGKQKRGIDLLVGRQGKFDEWKTYFPSIESEIAEKGLRLYEQVSRRVG